MPIERLNVEDKKALLSLYRTVTSELRRGGVKQWDWFYPNGFVIGKDLSQGTVYGIRQGTELIAAVAVNREFSAQYNGLHWEDLDGAPSCIHRLAVHPALQGRGLGKRLLQFAEEHAKHTGSTSVRLDVYTGNPGAVAIYERAGYREVGTVQFPMRKLPFLCMEKML
ncbi:GNAT family N-acetyltransferase [Paenibacillus cremeus]|uniref:GNAT family N-acetyltransferase n=1 Tax=Paenibacillus cremeus TaxID=2163881 RepID=A0A559KFL0_9BACL|nr:GNAT family N-acetyltransferase [Paenibacillus cremeus]TVY10910.1 GNAT family N-acetyltransferase [Paenibacillus cremeus]